MLLIPLRTEPLSIEGVTVGQSTPPEPPVAHHEMQRILVANDAVSWSLPDGFVASFFTAYRSSRRWLLRSRFSAMIPFYKQETPDGVAGRLRTSDHQPALKLGWQAQPITSPQSRRGQSDNHPCRSPGYTCRERIRNLCRKRT